ncbi:MAG: response regulator transcription factor [Actinobacteria bacterium]|nr:response regulator transcription factor [Actinomycetota bacterium]
MQDSERKLAILVYSHDAQFRRDVSSALGKRPAADLPEVVNTEVATAPMLWQRLEKEHFDLIIVDADATPAGGLGIARQAKDELFNCPPFLAIIARAQDAWLATWSKAEAVVPKPIDPFVLAETVSTLLRPRAAIPK